MTSRKIGNITLHAQYSIPTPHSFLFVVYSVLLYDIKQSVAEQKVLTTEVLLLFEYRKAEVLYCTVLCITVR